MSTPAATGNFARALPESNGERRGALSVSLIVAVEVADEGARRSLRDICAAVAGHPVEVIAASRERFPDAPAGVRVVVFDAASRGDRYDHAADAAHGALLAFTDDRVRLPATWAARVLELFRDPGVSVAGGPVLPRARGGEIDLRAIRGRVARRHVPAARDRHPTSPHPQRAVQGGRRFPVAERRR
ncbi:MAG: hypothetical protein E6J45_07375 [Chloroflexi bacterium]|nr:MAG: hypothetical protein E6J45_07375 [Chloroflexota bacterium]